MSSRAKTNLSRAKKGKFNIIDFLIIVLVIAVIAAVLVIWNPFSIFVKDGQKEAKLQYVIEFKNIDDEIKDGISVGEGVINSATGHNMGVVKSVDVEDAFQWVKMYGNNTMVRVTLSDKYNVFVTIEVDCIWEDGVGYLVDGKQIAVGSAVNVRFKNFEGSGYCVDITGNGGN